MHEVVWPRGRKTVGIIPFARRLDTLEGKTVGFLWNEKGYEVLPAIEKELAKRYRGIKFVSWDAFGSISRAQEGETLASFPVTLKKNKVDAAISATGL